MQPRPASYRYPVTSQQQPRGAIALSRTPAADDTDTATRQTVEKMCELIRQSCCRHTPSASAGTPMCGKCGKVWQQLGTNVDLNELAHENDPLFGAAAYAKKHFGMGSDDQAALAWGVFWYVKHCVKFRLDESTMFQVGEQQQQDLLIAPAVLVRMQDPSEDCDGFTMLTAAMLSALGVPVLIATVATEGQDPSRWSHVFLMAVVNGRMMPLDTSHGTAPGWMVPRDRVYRFQAWALDGRPANVTMPRYQGLHGYRTYPGLGAAPRGARRLMVPKLIPARGRGFGGRRGMGQDDTGDEYTGDETDDFYEDTYVPPSDLSQLPDSTTYTPAAASASAAAAGGCFDPASGLLTACPSGAPVGSAAPSSVCAPGYVLYNLGTCVPASGGLPSCGGAGQIECVSGAPPASATPNYAALASQIIATAGADAKAAIQQPQNLLAAQTWANLAAYLPILGAATLGVIVLLNVMGSKK